MLDCIIQKGNAIDIMNGCFTVQHNSLIHVCRKNVVFILIRRNPIIEKKYKIFSSKK